MDRARIVLLPEVPPEIIPFLSIQIRATLPVIIKAAIKTILSPLTLHLICVPSLPSHAATAHAVPTALG
jgi:hypothetical protein